MASSSRLKPGEKGAIIARVATVNKTGLVVETIEVSTNDPKRRKVILTVQAVIGDHPLP